MPYATTRHSTAPNLSRSNQTTTVRFLLLTEAAAAAVRSQTSAATVRAALASLSFTFLAMANQPHRQSHRLVAWDYTEIVHPPADYQSPASINFVEKIQRGNHYNKPPRMTVCLLEISYRVFTRRSKHEANVLNLHVHDVCSKFASCLLHRVNSPLAS